MQAPGLGPFRNSFIVREALRVAPGRPNYAAGLRAGLATVLPLLLSSGLARPELIWTSLAGFMAVLADKGGAYHTRARSMLTLALTGSMAVLLGTLAADAAHPALSVLLVMVVVGLAGFVRVFGAEATSIGVVTSVTLVVALARPVAEPSAALVGAGFSLLGTGWAALLSLVLWPLRPYRPARFAIAAVLEELSRVAQSFVAGGMEPSAQVARREQLGRTREAIESARAALGKSRRSRPGPSRPGEQLVALLEAADQLFGALVALEDGLALEPPEALPALPEQLDRVASEVGAQLEQLAQALVREQPLGPPVPSRPGDAAGLSASIDAWAQSSGEHAPRLLLRALERLSQVVELTRAVDDPTARPRASRAEPSELSTEASKLSLLRDHLTLDSAMFRHALRMALSTAAAVLVGRALHIEHGYWATLTCLVIMQPHGAATWAKALQRVLGTVLGAGVALLVATYVHEPHGIIAFVFLFVVLGMAVLPLNYGAFAIFLTPGFVLLAEQHAGDVDLVSVRVLNTLLGALIALLGSRLLFPLSERDQFRPLMAEALMSLQWLLDVAASERPSALLLRTARRKLGLALLNVEASYQRLLTESGLAPEESEALLTLILYAHRLASGLIALAHAEGTAAQRRLIDEAPTIARALAHLHRAAREGSLLAVTVEPASVHAGVSAGAGQADRVDRLFAQLSVLASATTRWNSYLRAAG